MSESPLPAAPASSALPRRVRVGECEIDLATHAVEVDGQFRQRLTPKALGVLRVLLEQDGRPVHRDELIRKVWPRQLPTDDVVTKAIRELRRALGDTDEQPVIVTLPRIGYQLAGSVSFLGDGGDPEPAPELAPLPQSGVPGQPDSAPTWREVRRRASVLGWVGLVVAGVVWVAWIGWPRTPAPADSELRTDPSSVFAPRLEVQPFTADPGDEGAADVSDDGLLVAYSSRRRGAAHYRIHIRSVDGLAERRLTSTDLAEDELQPVFAPDGHRIAYQVVDAEGGCSLRLLDLNGGTPRRLLDCHPQVGIQMEFARDGSHLLLMPPHAALPAVGRLQRLDLASGALAPLPSGETGAAVGIDVEGRYSPDGQWLMIRRGAAPDSRLLLRSTDPDAVPQPIAGVRGLIRGMAWLPDSRNVVFATDATGVMELWRLDTRTGYIERFGGVAGEYPAVAARAPVLVTRQMQRASALIPLQLDGIVEPAPQPLFASNRSESWPAYAPNGRSMAFVSDRSGSSEIHVGDLESETAQQVTRLGEGQPYALSYAPDGQHIAFTLRRIDRTEVGLIDLGARWTRMLTLRLARPERLRFAPDGSLWFSAEPAPGAPHRLYRMADADAEPVLLDGPECAGHAPHPVEGGDVWFHGPGYDGLYRWRAAEQRCVLEAAGMGWPGMDGWTATGKDAWRLDGGAEGLGLYRQQGPEARQIEPLDMRIGQLFGLAIRADLGEAVLGVAGAAQADLMLVSGF